MMAEGNLVVVAQAAATPRRLSIGGAQPAGGTGPDHPRPRAAAGRLGLAEEAELHHPVPLAVEPP